METLFAPQAKSYQMVKADEVVDMGMGYEDVREAQDLAGRESPDVSQVEEQCSAPMEEIDVDSRIVKGAIDKAWMELGRHASCSFLCLMAESGSKVVSGRSGICRAMRAGCAGKYSVPLFPDNDEGTAMTWQPLIKKMIDE